MKKEELIALGLSDEQAEKVLEGYKGYIPKNRFDEVNEAKKNAEALVKERDNQIEALKADNADNEALKTQIAKLQADNQKAVEAKDAEIKKIKLDNAVHTALVGAGAKNVKAVLPFLNLEKADIDENGIVTGLSEQIEALKKVEDCSFLFKAEKIVKTKGVTPASANDDGKHDGLTKADFAKMSYKERAKLFDEDEELYNSLAKE